MGYHPIHGMSKLMLVLNVRVFHYLKLRSEARTSRRSNVIPSHLISPLSKGVLVWKIEY